ncbi:MAG: S8 family peptidase [Pseudomonadota bacterium]
MSFFSQQNQNITLSSDKSMKRKLSNIAFSSAALVIIALSGNHVSSHLTGSAESTVVVQAAAAPAISPTATASLATDVQGATSDSTDATPIVLGEASVVIVAGNNNGDAASTRRSDKRAERVLPTDKISAPVAAAIAAGGTGPVDLIVDYAQQPELFDDEYIAELGGEVTRSFDGLGMRAIRLPADAVLRFADTSRVNWLSLDEPVYVMSETARRAANQPRSGNPNLHWDGWKVGVAILDSGVAYHTDLDSNMLQYNFLNGRYPRPALHSNNQLAAANADARQDNFGHGTHVAGILSGDGYNSHLDYRGVATGAKLLSLQVLNADGSGSMSDVMAGLDWLLQYGDTFNIRVVNLSLGKQVTESYATDPLVHAVEQLWDAGIVVVIAAGNDGRYGNMTINSPGNSRKVITVGSVSVNGTGANYSDDYVSSFSSRGPSMGDLVMKPDLLAPGNKVVASVQGGTFLDNALPGRRKPCSRSTACADNYLEMSGTSMATPLVAAAAALMIEKNPSITPDTVKARLMRSARKIDASPIEAGAGVLDINAALNETGIMYRSALSPLANRGQGNQGILIEDTAALWGHSRWSASYLYQGGDNWSDGSGSGDSSINATGFLWTDETVQARGFLWTDEVFARGFLWTDETVEARSLLDFEGVGEADLNDDP